MEARSWPRRSSPWRHPRAKVLFPFSPIYSTKLRVEKMLCEFWKAKLFKIQCFLVYLHTSTALQTSGYSLLYLQSPVPCICTKLKPWIKGYRGLVPPVSPTSPAQHRLTPHFPLLIPWHAERLRLKAFSLPQFLSVQNFYPTLVKREDARSGFSNLILICFKSQKTLHKTTRIVMLSEVETSQTKEEETCYYSTLRIGTAL